MTREQASQLGDISGAIDYLREAISMIDSRVRGTNDPGYDWVKNARRVHGEASKAYDAIAKTMR